MSLHRQTVLIAAMAALALVTMAGSAAETSDTPLPAGVKRLNIPGVHNAFAIGTNLFSGSTPETDEGFATLRALGVKTIISVDGAPPDADAARKHGIRYVHLPCGYDGIQTNRQEQLAKAAATLPGPIFVHCHHGAHRGPAAAAIIAMASQVWTTNTAESWLHAAGTGTNYLGLYASVREFHPPTASALTRLPADFPERALSNGLVEAMVEIDRRWENLKAIRAADYKSTAQQPGLNAAHELNLLREHYREAQRLPVAVSRGRDFIQRLAEAEAHVVSAEQFIASNTPRTELNRAFDALRTDCATCHRRHRDN
jgi:protein tyrosine phosphatase (PTP) superfamily phosphohydrolase (DUF442 family)